MCSSPSQGSVQNAGLLSHKIQRNEVQAGDHIYTYPKSLISNHGIYVGDGKVVHFTARISDSTPASCPVCGDRVRASGVISSCLQCFLDGGEVYRFQYGLSTAAFVIKLWGQCTTAASDPVDDVIHRAEFLLQTDTGFRVYEYDHSSNHSQDFATYCKTEIRAPIMAWSCPTVVKGVVCAAYKTKYFAIVAVAASGIIYCKSRYSNDIGVRRDVTRIPVEDLAAE